jgi:DNA-binding FrmR family transcriptional regulator
MARAKSGKAVRQAHGVDPQKKSEALRRLKRIEGQVRGLQRMVEDERYCADILMQIASVQQALSGAGRLVMRNHLENCITDALRSGDPKAAKDAYDELISLVYRYTTA